MISKSHKMTSVLPAPSAVSRSASAALILASALSELGSRVRWRQMCRCCSLWVSCVFVWLVLFLVQMSETIRDLLVFTVQQEQGATLKAQAAASPPTGASGRENPGQGSL